ncbi:RNA 2'-phosphotransferase [Clostridium sp. E02]|uniref:RNA 2'-phosphotransferase n=1 Tax=Clostridium sp. E02 TaxID=2487134 RepID=UPI001FAAC1E8|nr:RNA 2'-phosphotransferase [Clostridium sp. E02]
MLLIWMDSISEKGLLPRSRQYVHLSQDIETAENVGKRHDNNSRILVIDSLSAWNDGIKFYYGNEKVWLADMVPSKYILEK